MFFEDIIFENNYKDKQVELYTCNDGFWLGNMFKKEYKGFKNYKPTKIRAKNEKDDLLLRIYELDFAINDLSLYLDLHCDDLDVYKIFRGYVNEYNKLIEKYEIVYGPLELNQSEYQNYEWANGLWPFEGVDI